jgi:cell division protein FtsI/penicillin-binding protein 2
VGTEVLPLSLTKLLLAASWWDNDQPDTMFANATIHDMLVGSIDSAGREMAIALRKSIGTKAVLGDLARYGFGARSGAPDKDFWREPPESWAARLEPGAAYVSLRETTNDVEWADTFSIGEANAGVTALHVSRFMQAVGNNGWLVKPIARLERASIRPIGENRVKIRLMQKNTALRLQAAMRDTVARGTARGIARALAGTGWQIGGRTGSGPALTPKRSQLDGWFAGLIFDPSGRPRFAVATFVAHGGLGGGKAAKISAHLALFLIGGT